MIDMEARNVSLHARNKEKLEEFPCHGDLPDTHGKDASPPANSSQDCVKRMRDQLSFESIFSMNDSPHTIVDLCGIKARLSELWAGYQPTLATHRSPRG